MVNKADTNKARLNRHKRVRGKISGTAECPRLNVFRSTKDVYKRQLGTWMFVALLLIFLPEYRSTYYIIRDNGLLVKNGLFDKVTILYRQMMEVADCLLYTSRCV